MQKTDIKSQTLEELKKHRFGIGREAISCKTAL